jgi:hypothetical protein
MKRQNIIQAIIIFVIISIAVFVTIDQTLPPDAIPVSAQIPIFQLKEPLSISVSLLRIFEFPAHWNMKNRAITSWAN